MQKRNAYRKVNWSFTCEDCREPVVERVCYRQVKIKRFCRSCGGVKGWQRRHKKEIEDYQRRYRALEIKSCNSE